jgi:hypothetical protein
MTNPIVNLPLSGSSEAANVNPARKKRILLWDTSQTKRDLRADVMRKLGMEVDCAADVIEARCWWKADLYNLVLISVPGETDSRDEFCADLRGASPLQRIAFLVGAPDYLASAPPSGTSPAGADTEALQRELAAALLVHGGYDGAQQWGILEACKRISSVRAVSEARSRAIRETPRPSRWAEAVEQHSVVKELHSQPSFAALGATERELLS